MKDGGGEGSIGMAFAEDFDKVWRAASAARSDDWDVQAVGNGASQFTVEAGGGAVAVHGSEKDLPGTAGFGFQSPFHGIAIGGYAASVGEGLPGAVVALGVDGDDDRL